MTEEIKEEKKCEHFYFGDCNITHDGCLENENCSHRQLQRLKQENDILRKTIKDKNIVSACEQSEKYRRVLESVGRMLLGVNGASPRSDEQLLKIRQMISEVLK